MTRRRYIGKVVNGQGTWVEVDKDFSQDPSVQDSVLWNDREYQDMGDARFSSRSQHREYMKSRGLTTTDDYLGGTWKRDEEKRIAAKQGFDPSRHEDVVQAIHKLKSRK